MIPLCTQGDLFPANETEKNIAALAIKCPRGCDANIAISEIEGHKCAQICPHCQDLVFLKTNQVHILFLP